MGQNQAPKSYIRRRVSESTVFLIGSTISNHVSIIAHDNAFYSIQYPGMTLRLLLCIILLLKDMSDFPIDFQKPRDAGKAKI